jgi:hypothetical protein
MNPGEWIALAAIVVSILGVAFKQGRDSGEIKAMVENLIDRLDRGGKRMDATEANIAKHGERIARLEAGRDRS